MKFRMEVDQTDLYQGKVIIPWYMGRSYSDWCMSIYYYHIIPLNFVARWALYMYYMIWSFTKGPEHFVIIDRVSFAQVLRAEYERGREKADEYFEQEVKQESYRRNRKW